MRGGEVGQRHPGGMPEGSRGGRAKRYPPRFRHGKKSHPGGVLEPVFCTANLASRRDAGVAAHAPGVTSRTALLNPPATFWHPAGMARRGMQPFSCSTENGGEPSFPLVAGFDQERRKNPVKDSVNFTGSLRFTVVFRGARSFGNVQTVQSCFSGGLPMIRCAH